MKEVVVGSSVSRSFGDFAHTIKEAVDRELPRWLAPHVAKAKELGGTAFAVSDAIAQFVTRGGKRVRPVLMGAAFEAYGGQSAMEILPALLSVELLQAYLLIHDDWMDEDEVRRGGPTVHVALREHFASSRAGEIGAVLAGDLAMGYSLTALLETRTTPDRLAEATRELARMQVEVVAGQVLDVYHDGKVETVHDLKTTSYTVRGPLLLGASLAGASASQKAELEAFAQPLGLAFQVRDDLLGTFGDPRKTGKSAAGDLQQGKRTALVQELLAADRSGEDRALVERVLGIKDAPAADVARVLERLATARPRVEARLSALLDESRAHLARMDLREEARTILAGAVSALGERER
ncbi:polyprenyl synthetase family protein [Pendulispora brunnea]|uniref:Polyprenyl synthetase family protein n=1 Tax=Pendulispora brunnea TaxID=2905690 RepID=A0ABZ2KPG1_9BACT